MDRLVLSDSFDPRKPQGKTARVPLASVDRVKGDLKNHLGSDDVNMPMALEGQSL